MGRARTSKVFLLGAAVLLLASNAEAGWQEQASAFDTGRLEKLDEARAKGLKEAEAGASERDLAVVHEVLDAPATEGGGSLDGRWRCRTIKLGGMTPVIIYSWFSCRISGEHFVKLNGSQRMSGRLYPNASGGFVYLGASSVKGEPMHRYSGPGQSAGAQVTPDDQIGLLTATGPGSARLELPYPVQESTFDVVELRR